MRTSSLAATAGILALSATCFLFTPAQASSASKDRVITNVSHDVCVRRLRRGQECLYPYWYPYWSPDLAYMRPVKHWHFWPYWNW